MLWISVLGNRYSVPNVSRTSILRVLRDSICLSTFLSRMKRDAIRLSTFLSRTRMWQDFHTPLQHSRLLCNETPYACQRFFLVCKETHCACQHSCLVCNETLIRLTNIPISYVTRRHTLVNISFLCIKRLCVPVNTHVSYVTRLRTLVSIVLSCATRFLTCQHSNNPLSNVLLNRSLPCAEKYEIVFRVFNTRLSTHMMTNGRTIMGDEF